MTIEQRFAYHRLRHGWIVPWDFGKRLDDYLFWARMETITANVCALIRRTYHCEAPD